MVVFRGLRALRRACRRSRFGSPNISRPSLACRDRGGGRPVGADALAQPQRHGSRRPRSVDLDRVGLDDAGSRPQRGLGAARSRSASAALSRATSASSIVSAQPARARKTTTSVVEAVGGDDLHAGLLRACRSVLARRRAASGSERDEIARRRPPRRSGSAPDRPARRGLGSDGRSASAPAKRRRLGQAGVLDHRHRCRRDEARLDQPRGDLGGDRAAHIDGDGGAGERQPGPVRQRVAFGVVAGGEDQRRGDVAQGQRNFGLGGGGEAPR